MAVKAIDISTAGIRFGYAIESSVGVKPSAFVNFANPKSIPDLSPEPNGLDTSSLNIEAGGYKTYIEGLKDIGGSIGIGFGMSQLLLDTWNNMCEASKTAEAQNKRTWFVFYHPALDKSFFMTGQPSKLGFPEAEVDTVWDATAYVMPTGELGWDSAINPTDPVSA